MKIMKKVLWLFILAGFAGCSHQPEKPLELQLTLAKKKIKASEFLWYRVEMKNVGRKSIRITDPFWKMQEAAGHQASQTKLEIIGPNGKLVERKKTPYGYHIEHKFWTSDCGDNRACVEPIELQGGETFTATPSIPAPIRKRNPHIMDDMGDMRDLPEIPKGWSKEQVEALRKSWKTTVENSGYKMGDPTFRPDPKAPAASQPRGYRVLDVYDFYVPGKYRMRMVYRPFGYDTAETFKETAARVGYSVPKYLASEGWPKETKVLAFASNWVQFEAEAVAFPEHLFQRNVKEKQKDRARTEWLKKKLRESQDWKYDSNPPSVKARGSKP